MADPTPPPTNPALAILSQARALWQRVPSRARLGAIAAVVGILGLVGFLALRPGPPPWKPVGGQLTPGDANELVTVLNGQGISNRLTKGGRGVEVPASDLAAATVAAASVGLPRHGEGAETLKDLGPFPTDRAEKEKFRRALEGELARSIASLSPVETARVHVAFGRQSMIKELEEPPTASVQVHLRAGQTLVPAQVAGVKNLVAAAVDGLTADRVVVVDQHGEVLSADDHGSTDDVANTERDVAAKVRAMLEKSLGVGKVEVVVHADIDRSKTSTTEDRYDPAGNAIINETRTVDAPGTAQGAGTTVVGGVAGTSGNLQGTGGTTGTTGGAAPGQVINEQKTYANSHTVTQTEAAPARVARLQVAVLVDYKTPADGGDAAPPSKAELDAYTQLARTAAGIDDKRGDQLELRALPFAAQEPLAAPKAAKPKLPVPLPLLAAGAVALIGIIVGLLALRRRKAAAAEVTPPLALPAPIAEVERALEPGAATDAPGLPAPTEKSLEERVLASVKTDLPRAARVLASWLAEPDPATPHAKGGKA